MINNKPMGIVLLLLGAFGIFHGLSYLAGSEALPDGSGSCRAVCGFILLATQSFGELVGRLVAGFLWSFVGLFLFYFGYKLKNE
jgi:hydrogenase/urease accessory protein HupE